MCYCFIVLCWTVHWTYNALNALMLVVEITTKSKKKQSRMILNFNRSDNLYRFHLYYVVTDYFTFKGGLCFPPSKKIKIFTRNRNQIFLDKKESIFFLRMLPKFLLENCRVKLIMFFALHQNITFYKIKKKEKEKKKKIFSL